MPTISIPARQESGLPGSDSLDVASYVQLEAESLLAEVVQAAEAAHAAGTPTGLTASKSANRLLAFAVGSVDRAQGMLRDAQKLQELAYELGIDVGGADNWPAIRRWHEAEAERARGRLDA